MADKMMRIAGRSEEGVAKAISTDDFGNVGVQGKAKEFLVMNRDVTIQPGNSYDWKLPEPFIGRTHIWVSRVDDKYSVKYYARQSDSGSIYTVDVAESDRHQGQVKYSFPEDELPTMPTRFDTGYGFNTLRIQNEGSVPINPVIVITSLDGSVNNTDVDVKNFPSVQEVKSITYKEEMYRENIERIVDIVGLEDIALFLPMWQGDDGKIRDVLRKNLSFSIKGNASIGNGPFGSSVSISQGNNGYLEEDSVISNLKTTGTNDNKLTNKAHKIAVSIAGNEVARVKRARLSLKKIGSPTSYIGIKMYDDDAGKPGKQIQSIDYFPSYFKTKQGIYTGFLSNATREVGLSFDDPIDIEPNKVYWLVLEYIGEGTVDANNCISWVGSDEGQASGSKKALFDGVSWTVTNDSNLYFDLYTDVLDLEGRECTVIAAAKPLSKTGMIMATRQKTEKTASPRVFTMGFRNGVACFGVSSVPYSESLDGYREHPAFGYYSQNWKSFALTVSGKWSLERYNGYIDGIKVLTAQATQTDAVEGMELPARSEPWTFGSEKNANGNFLNQWIGNIGPIIIAKRKLSDSEVAKIHSLLFSDRLNQGGNL